MAYDTPKAQRTITAIHRTYSDEEKYGILENFDLEVETRTKRMRQRLDDDLSDYRARCKQVVSKIPRVLLSMTVEEFALKYDGSITKYMEMITKEKMADGMEVDIEASVRKRKHQSASSQEGPPKATKTARKAPASPTKPLAPVPDNNSTPLARRFLGARTPGKSTLSFASSGILSRARFATSSQPIAGPSRPSTSVSNTQAQSPERTRRPPSSAHFNPSLPPKTPAYPRAPRRDEHILSANGSPLANPWASNTAAPAPSRMMESALPEEPSELEERNPRPPSVAPTSRNMFSHPRSTPGVSVLFSVRTKSGVLMELDPNISPTKDENPFAKLSESAKKEVRADVLKLAERYGLLNVGT